jgi:hypothetical protein
MQALLDLWNRLDRQAGRAVEIPPGLGEAPADLLHLEYLKWLDRGASPEEAKERAVVEVQRWIRRTRPGDVQRQDASTLREK